MLPKFNISSFCSDNNAFWRDFNDSLLENIYLTCVYEKSRDLRVFFELFNIAEIISLIF